MIKASYNHLLHFADQDDARSQFTLGLYHQFPLCGLERNSEKAFACYQKAADQGCLEAINQIAKCHLEGIDVPVNIKKAIYYFQKIADQKHSFKELSLTQKRVVAYANFMLGNYYLNGHYLPPDSRYYLSRDGKKAVYYLQKAADQNHPLAAGCLKALLG